MNKVRRSTLINLLPIELQLVEIRLAKEILIRNIAIAATAIAIVVSLSSVLINFALSIKVKEVLAKEEDLKAKLQNLAPKEGLILSLKQRLKKINELQNIPEKKAAAFNLVTNLLPEGVKVFLLDINEKEIVKINGEAPDISTLSVLIDRLTIPEQNENKIPNVKLESLSLGADGFLRFDLSLTLKI